MYPIHLYNSNWVRHLQIQWIVLTVFLLSGGPIHAAGTAVFTDSGSAQSELAPVNTALVIRQRPVEISIESFADNDFFLPLHLFDDVELTAVLDHIEEDSPAGQAWIGTIEGIENSAVSLVIDDGKLSGSINLPDVMYQIRPVENRLHVVREIDSTALQAALYDWNQQVYPDISGLQTNEQLPSGVTAYSTDQTVDILSPEELQVLNLVNQERAINGLSLLSADALLTSSARAHSLDMSQQNYFSHTGLDGSTPSQRIAATGYQYNAVGENIAKGYTTAESVMNGWMNSPGHKANILESNFCDIGIGYVADGYHWTQNFGRKQGVSTCPSVDSPGNPDPTPPPATDITPPLQNGATTNYNLAQHDTLEFVVEIPENTSKLTVQISGSGDADLYVKKTAINWPGDSGQHDSAEFKSPWINGSNESVTFDLPGKGTWHILIHGYTAASGTISATWLPINQDAPGEKTDNANLLENGSSTDFSLSRQQIIDYRINLPASVNKLQVTMTGSGDADLYVKNAPINWPQDSGRKNSSGFKAPWKSGSNETVSFSHPKQGQWHVLIHGYRAAQGKVSVAWE